MNARVSKKIEKLKERFQTLSDEDLVHEYEKLSLWSAQQYYKMIKSGKAKSLGSEISALSQEFMRRGIVDKLEPLLKNENIGVQADAAYLMLLEGKLLPIQQLLDILQNIQDSRQDEYASTEAFGALSRYDDKKWIKEHT